VAPWSTPKTSVQARATARQARVIVDRDQMRVRAGDPRQAVAVDKTVEVVDAIQAKPRSAALMTFIVFRARVCKSFHVLPGVKLLRLGSRPHASHDDLAKQRWDQGHVVW
jgi:hypothetical protein